MQEDEREPVELSLFGETAEVSQDADPVAAVIAAEEECRRKSDCNSSSVERKSVNSDGRVPVDEPQNSTGRGGVLARMRAAARAVVAFFS
ncbi:hypothetical protein GRS48_12615 [Halorubrum sp. JWXQ-INN 858]|uniref:hypothetical protein n=1 Tax=Halorubrum sp. JWXQ-INN 858 TaxID=2690782 RepID=UPI00135B727B|nr:hypothetical protein [Halorubrum sp. JWXQ-INN 858]MWV65655.1 hypothetical protein [Halorubrum sp. JWXQ-INN 858]